MPQKKEGGITLDDLAQMVAGGFTELGGRMDKIEGRMDTLEAKMDQRFTVVEDRLLTLERTVAKTNERVLDLTEEVSAMNTAIENDTRHIIDHEHRITSLEAAAI